MNKYLIDAIDYFMQPIILKCQSDFIPSWFILSFYIRLSLSAMMLLNLVILMVVVQCSYALYFYGIVLISPKADTTKLKPEQGVSIIICAKNEGANLAKNLPVVLSQEYDGNYEVIVVNDGSNDDTGQVLKILKGACENLIEVIISSFEHRSFKGKKYALSKGVAIAKYDWLLLIDADCMPASEFWLQQMLTPLANGKEIVAGYGGYNKGNGLLNSFTRWETIHTFMQHSSYAFSGLPYMAVGRNMACTREIFLKAQQSKVWNEVPSGDDDLLVRICATNENMAIVSDPSAFTRTDTKATWKEWIAQKQRHMSTGKYYKRHIQLLLGLYAISHAIFWLGIGALAFGPHRYLVLALILIRCLISWAVWRAFCNRLKERGLVYLFPLFDIGWMIYNFAFLPYITWKNKKTWK